jgi:hypothetical protein
MRRMLFNRESRFKPTCEIADELPSQYLLEQMSFLYYFVDYFPELIIG